MSIFGKRRQKLDLDALEKQATDALEQVKAQEPRVNYLATWLKNRENQNGFGEDFDWSLRPRGARS